MNDEKKSNSEVVVKPSAYRNCIYTLKTLEPLHIGAGGYRLGRVDNSICREPSTNLPKIPGTALSGALKAHADLYLRSRHGKEFISAGTGPSTAKMKEYRGDKAMIPKMIADPINFAFGVTESVEEGKSYRGVLQFCDAQILFFPLYCATKGVVWVTSPSAIKNSRLATGEVVEPKNPDKVRLIGKNSWKKGLDKINLGWLYLEVEDGNSDTDSSGVDLNWETAVPKEIVLVSEKLFSVLVNDNLEVRTSVCIDARTGAAKSGALFTYEAVPRDTWFVYSVVENNYRGEAKWKQMTKYDKQEWKSPIDVLEAANDYASKLGIGGMSTRGFGRVEISLAKEVKANPEGGTK